MNKNQSTIKESVTLAGIGLHTGREVVMTFHPTAPDFGIRFRRIDLPGMPEVEALAEYVTGVARGTTLQKSGARVSTVEHVLAALAGLQIDNVLIDLNNEETPIMDGSSRVFVEVIRNVGILDQMVPRQYFEVKEPLSFEHLAKDAKYSLLPADGFEVEVSIDYNSKVLGRQKATLPEIGVFNDDFAASRTFCFLHELEMLLEHDLIRGGDLSNAIVVVDKAVEDHELKRLSVLFNNREVEVKEEGILNNIELRYENEPARHKLLDVVGDLMLVGRPIKGKVIAEKPGHASNVEFAKLIRKEMKKKSKTPILPHYDPTVPPVFDINQIKEFLPHKYPFLLVDKIISLNETRVTGIKNVTYNEQFFLGHFPNEPVMPGVLIIEAMAQTGGILVMNTLPDPKEYITYFLKIDNARFKSKVVPGDTLIFEMELTSPIRRGICEMHGNAYVGNKLAASANLMAQVVKKEI